MQSQLLYLIKWKITIGLLVHDIFQFFCLYSYLTKGLQSCYSISRLLLLTVNMVLGFGFYCILILAISPSLRLLSEKAMAPHSSTLAWKIPWIEEPSGLQSMGLLRVRHNWATSLSLFTFVHWRRKWQPTSVFLPGESQGRGSLVGCHLWGRTERGTGLMRLSSSSSSKIIITNLCQFSEHFVFLKPSYLHLFV